MFLLRSAGILPNNYDTSGYHGKSFLDLWDLLQSRLKILAAQRAEVHTNPQDSAMFLLKAASAANRLHDESWFRGRSVPDMWGHLQDVLESRARWEAASASNTRVQPPHPMSLW